ncbi:MAG: hypothetical protein MZU95_01280 [Desulfomicrobium escambiense]|nr:hypothetical protein [Desulfomicrobium escambiense]
MFRYRTLTRRAAHRAGALRRWRARRWWSGRVGGRHGAGVDVVARQLLERPRAAAGVRAVRAPGDAAPRAVRRAAKPWRTVGEACDPAD